MLLKITLISMILCVMFSLLFNAIRKRSELYYITHNKYPMRYTVLGVAVLISFLSAVVFGIIAIIIA